MGLFSLFKKKSKKEENKPNSLETFDSSVGPIWKPPLNQYGLSVDVIEKWPDDIDLIKRTIRAYLTSTVLYPDHKGYETEKYGEEICWWLCQDANMLSRIPEAALYNAEIFRHSSVTENGVLTPAWENYLDQMQYWLHHARECADLTDLNYYLMAWSNWYTGSVRGDDSSVPQDALNWSNGDIEEILGWCRHRVEKDRAERVFPTGLILLRHYLVLREFWHEREPRENPMDFWKRMWMRYHLDEMLVQLAYAIDWTDQNAVSTGGHPVSENVMDYFRIAGEHGNPIALNQSRFFKWKNGNAEEAARWKDMWQCCADRTIAEQANLPENWYEAETSRAAEIAANARKCLKDEDLYPLALACHALHREEECITLMKKGAERGEFPAYWWLKKRGIQQNGWMVKQINNPVTDLDRKILGLVEQWADFPASSDANWELEALFNLLNLAYRLGFGWVMFRGSEKAQRMLYHSIFFDSDINTLYDCLESMQGYDLPNLVNYLRTVKPETERETDRLYEVWERLTALLGDFAEKNDNGRHETRNKAIGDFYSFFTARQFLKLDLKSDAVLNGQTVKELLHKVEEREPETISYIGDLYFNCEAVHRNEESRRKVGDVLLRSAGLIYKSMGDWCMLQKNIADKPYLKYYFLEKNLRHNKEAAAAFARERTYSRYPAFCAMLADRNYQREIRYSLDEDYVNVSQSMQAALDDGYPLQEVFDEMERQWAKDAALDRWGREQEQRRENARSARERAIRVDALRDRLDWAERDFDILAGGNGLTVAEKGLLGQIRPDTAITHEIFREAKISKLVDE